MLSSDQIRAGRAFLSWSRESLASKAGVTSTTIKNIEDGNVAPHSTTMAAIETVFKENDLEFPNGGVRRQDQTLQTLDGENDLLKLLDIVFYTLEKAEDKTVRMLFVDFDLTPESLMARLEELEQKGIIFKSITKADTEKTFGLCHALADQDFHNNPKIIFDDRTAVIVDEPSGKNKILIIRHNSMAEIEKKAFDFIWRMTKKIEK